MITPGCLIKRTGPGYHGTKHGEINTLVKVPTGSLLLVLEVTNVEGFLSVEQTKWSLILALFDTEVIDCWLPSHHRNWEVVG